MSEPRANYITDGLISRARLTDEEIADCPRPPAYFVQAFPFANDASSGHYEVPALTPRVVSDVATAKALWACVEWLADFNKEDADYLAIQLQQAGIERSKRNSYRRPT